MDEWVVVGDGGSGSDTASEDGSESGFAIVRGRRDRCRGAGLVSPVDSFVSVAPASPPRAAAPPQPTPPGLFRVVSYGDAFKDLASSGDGGHGGEAVVEGDGTETVEHGVFGAAIGDVAGQEGTVEAPCTAAVPAVPAMVTSPIPSFSQAPTSQDAALPELSVGMNEKAETEEVEEGHVESDDTVGFVGRTRTRTYDDIDTSHESYDDEDDDHCDSSDAEDSSGTEGESSCEEDDDDTDSSEVEESSSDEDDEYSDVDSPEQEESGCDEEEGCDYGYNFDDDSFVAEEADCNNNNKDVMDTAVTKESRYGDHDDTSSFARQIDDCDEEDKQGDAIGFSAQEETNCNGGDGIDASDTTEESDSEDDTDTWEATESDSEEDDDMDTSDTTEEESDCDEEDDVR